MQKEFTVIQGKNPVEINRAMFVYLGEYYPNSGLSDRIGTLIGSTNDGKYIMRFNVTEKANQCVKLIHDENPNLVIYNDKYLYLMDRDTVVDLEKLR